MAANLLDKFKKVGVAGTLTTLQAPGKALGASSINIGSGTNYPTDTGFIIAIRQVDGSGELVAGTYTEWNATISGTTVTISTTPRYGSDQIYPAGSSTQVYIPLSAARDNDLVDGVLVGHNQDGTHKAFTETNIISATAIQDNAVTTNKINNAAVTSSKLSTGAATALVAAAETTTSTSFADLTTTTDTVTVTIGANGLALVAISSPIIFSNIANTIVYIGFAISGATTVAASDSFSVNYQSYANNAQHGHAGTFLVTGLNAGSTTFKMKYRVSGNTGSFANRRISVVPL